MVLKLINIIPYLGFCICCFPPGRYTHLSLSLAPVPCLTASPGWWISQNEDGLSCSSNHHPLYLTKWHIQLLRLKPLIIFPSSKCVCPPNQWVSPFLCNSKTYPIFVITTATISVWKWKVKVTQSCLTFRDPMDYTVHGSLQARILEWIAFPFSRESSQPRDQTQVSRIAGRFFTSWAAMEDQEYWSG